MSNFFHNLFNLHDTWGVILNGVRHTSKFGWERWMYWNGSKFKEGENKLGVYCVECGKEMESESTINYRFNG